MHDNLSYLLFGCAGVCTILCSRGKKGCFPAAALLTTAGILYALTAGTKPGDIIYPIVFLLVLSQLLCLFVGERKNEL